MVHSPLLNEINILGNYSEALSGNKKSSQSQKGREDSWYHLNFMLIIQKDKHLSAPITGSRRCAISCTRLMRRNLQILYCNPFTDRTALCGCNQFCPYTQSSLIFLLWVHFITRFWESQGILPALRCELSFLRLFPWIRRGQIQNCCGNYSRRQTDSGRADP